MQYSNFKIASLLSTISATLQALSIEDEVAYLIS